MVDALGLDRAVDHGGRSGVLWALREEGVAMTMLTEPGFYEIDAADYHADPAPEPSLSQSIGKILLEHCPRAAWWAHSRLNPQFTPQEDIKFDRGNVAHALLLGKGREFRIVDGADYRSKAAQIQRDVFRSAGFIPILAGQHEVMVQMVAAARKQLASIDEGQFAFTPEWGEVEICVMARDPADCWTRALIDFYGSKMLSGVTCWDYKTTSGTANPSMLMTTFNRLGWAFQAAFQERIICLLKPELAGKLRFRFFVQETEEPYLASVCEPSGAAMTLAHKMVAAAIGIWKRCLDTGQWPGYPAHSVPIGVPASAEASWLARELEDELVRLAADDPFLGGVYRQPGLTDWPPAPPSMKRRPGRPRNLPPQEALDKATAAAADAIASSPVYNRGPAEPSGS